MNLILEVSVAGDVARLALVDAANPESVLDQSDVVPAPVSPPILGGGSDSSSSDSGSSDSGSSDSGSGSLPITTAPAVP